MPNQSSPTFLESLVFCGLCFTQMKSENDVFRCGQDCPSIVSKDMLESVVWKEIGNFLSKPEGRKVAARHLGHKLSGLDVKHLFHDMEQFSEFLPVEDRKMLAEALIEKIEVLSDKAIHIHFRS